MNEERAKYKKCIQCEVYQTQNLSIFKKIIKKYFMPKYNSVYMIRKMFLHNQLAKKKGLFKSFHYCLAMKYRYKLIKKYSIDINRNAFIDIGLSIPHPISIVVGEAHIGKNCTLLHNTTIGSKRKGEALVLDKPTIGDDCILYANSMVLGPIKVGNDVTIGCFSCLLTDALNSGTYVGCPAKMVEKKEKISR